MSHDVLYAIFIASLIVGVISLIIIGIAGVHNDDDEPASRWRWLFIASIAFVVLGGIGLALTAYDESQREIAGFSLAF